MFANNEQYREFVEKQAQQKVEQEWKKQGEIIAGALKANFDAAILASKVTAPTAPKSGFPPPAPEGGASSAGQASAPGAAPLARVPQVAPAGGDKLTSLQRALVKSMLGGRIKVQRGDFEEIKKQILGKWTQRPVVQAIDNFIIEHGNMAKAPKPKDERLQLFWDILVGMQ